LAAGGFGHCSRDRAVLVGKLGCRGGCAPGCVARLPWRLRGAGLLARSAGELDAADVSAAVAAVELDQEHAGEHHRGGDRRRGGADRGELEVGGELGPRRAASERRSPRSSSTRSTPAASGEHAGGGDRRRRRGADRAELEGRGCGRHQRRGTEG